jgi:hypothetical protein
MMQTIYRGQIASQEGVIYTIEILKETDGEAAEVQDLSFPAEEPLVIEWGETSKEEVMCGSTATLTLLSPGDRTYLDLYTVQVGSVRMDVYRLGRLYWSGTLDTEFYEEPYSTTENYEVTLTFSDLGILDRLKYDGSGLENCWTLTERIIKAAGFLYTDLKEMCATSVKPDGETGLSQLTVRADNFYDEEGEASTLKEVLEGVLQPLGLRVVQYAGVVYVYDLESAYNDLPSAKVKWMSDDQTLGVDKVVNNVEIELSTYASEEVLTGDMDYPGTVTSGSSETADSDEGRKWSYYEDLNRTGKVQFTLYTTTTWDFNTKPGLAQVGDGNAFTSQPRWCHVDPLYGGEETDCVAIYWRADVGGTKDKPSWTGYGVKVSPYRTTSITADRDGGRDDNGRTETVITQTYYPGQLVYRSYQSYMQQLMQPEKYLLRVKIEMRLDTRYNLFGSGDDNCKEVSDVAEEQINMVRMRGRIQLKDKDGNVLMHVENLKDFLCQWVEGADEDESMVFCWRDQSDVTKAAVNGWMTNIHYGTRMNDGIEHIESEAAGTIIPYPPQPGYLEVELFSGVLLDHCEESRLSDGSIGYSDVWGKNGIESELFWWHLVKAPVVTLVNNDAKMSEVDTDDVTYSGELNAWAKEDLELNTICGTLETENAAARAVYMSAETGLPLKEMTRAGRTASAEQLLIGTLYSQFADRKMKLTGTVALTEAPFGLRTEHSAKEIYFLPTGEVQNLQADETEITMVELRPDEYEGSDD